MTQGGPEIQPITYQSTGVDYSAMDSFKRMAQLRARETSENLNYFGAKEVEASRGESAYVWEEQDSYRAFVIEGLGTKNKVADATRSITGRTHYDAIAQDTVAMIVNDLIVGGQAAFGTSICSSQLTVNGIIETIAKDKCRITVGSFRNTHTGRKTGFRLSDFALF